MPYPDTTLSNRPLDAKWVPFPCTRGGGAFAFEITDPGTPGNNPGWDTVNASTRIRFTATPQDKYTILLTTQVPPPAAPDTPGLMSNFDPARPYSWLFVSNPSGAVVDASDVNPVAFDPAAITLSATGTFLNPIAGNFSISITPNQQQVFINYTPVPEPAWALAVAGGCWMAFRRRALSDASKMRR